MSPPYQIPGIVLETMKMVPVQQWDLMFESLITEKALSISGCAKGKDLKKLQAKIEQLQELREFFKSEMTRK
jgi:hypothetical protein